MTRLLRFNTHVDSRGRLTFLEHGQRLPFAAQLVYYLHDVPPGSERGHHAHKRLREVLIPVSGGLTVITDDGSAKQEYPLHRHDEGLLLEPGTWFVLKDFAPGTVLLVLASGPYDEANTIRDYADFLAFAKGAAR